MSTAFHSFLGSEKAPYIVTLFVAVLAWTALRTVDRISGTPFVEYRIDLIQIRPDVAGVELRFRNITAASNFDCFLSTLVSADPRKLKLGDAADQQHVIRGSVASVITVVRARPNEWELEARNLSPGADIAIRAPIAGEGLPRVMVRPCASGDVSAITKDSDGKSVANPAVGAAPILIERSLATWFVEYELYVLWSALLIWFGLMVWVSVPKAPGLTSNDRTTSFSGKHHEDGTID